MVLYEVLGQQQDRCPNAFVLPLAPGKAACLFDVQRAMHSLGLGCRFSVLALVSGEGQEEDAAVGVMRSACDMCLLLL